MFFPIFSALTSVLPTAAAAGPEVTIYNGGFGLVKEVRTFNVKQGLQEIAVEGVPQQIEIDSVAVKMTGSNPFEVLEQNYRYDLISVQAILAKAVGKKIRFSRVLPNGQREVVEGILMSSPQAVVNSPMGGNSLTYNGMVIQTADGRVILNPSGEVEVDSIPEGLISVPSLIWLVDAKNSGNAETQVSYLTNGMSWTAGYVLQLDASGKTGDLKGWVNLANQSGATYRQAKLKLLAGEVNRVQNVRAPGAGGFVNEDRAVMKSAMMEEQFGDYHLYTLGRPTDILDNEAKQVSLLEGEGLSVTKRIIFDPMGAFRGYRPSEGEVGGGTMKPQVRIEFKNSKENHLGMPMPAGKFKIYQADKSGSPQLLGEDAIDHTPKDENLSLVIGRAFDIVGERKRTKFNYLNNPSTKSSYGMRETFVTELRNRKDTAEQVELIERYWGEWKLVEATEKGTFKDSDTFVFSVTLKPNEVRKVTYTVEKYWGPKP